MDSEGRRDDVPLFIDGFDLERWMLKILCGALGSSVLQVPEGSTKDWSPPEQWLTSLYAGERLSYGRGFYFAQDDGEQFADTAGIEIGCIAQDGTPLGLLLRMHGFQFVLAAEPFNLQLSVRDAIYRPAVFEFQTSQGPRSICLNWGPGRRGTVIKATWSG